MQSYSFLQSSLLQANALDSLIIKESSYGLMDCSLIQLQRLISIFLDVFNIKYGELFQLSDNGEYVNLNPSLDYGNYLYDYELWKHFNTVTDSSSPRKLPYRAIQSLFTPPPTTESLSFISYPLRTEKGPLGILILGGTSNGVPYAFQGMNARIIKNIIKYYQLEFKSD